ncbi:hypothetical protein OG216_37380 [Streptomycetaceae bacterium NBC_01309]
MNTFDTDDLRRILTAEAAENAPEMLGMVPSVVAAAPARRRRRAFQAGAVAAAVIAAAVTVPLVLAGGDRPTRHLPAAPTTSPAKNPVVLAASIEPGHGFAMEDEGFIGTTQKFSVRPEPLDSDYSGRFSVFAPGTFDPAPYTTGEQVTVQGQPAHFVDRFPFESPTPPYGEIATLYDTRVAWQDPSGYWLVYTQSDDSRDLALRVVETVRLGP